MSAAGVEPDDTRGGMRQTIEVLRRRNITALSSGLQLDRWIDAEPDRILPALGFDFGSNPVPFPENAARFLRMTPAETELLTSDRR